MTPSKVMKAVLIFYAISTAFQYVACCSYSSQRDALGRIVAVRSMEYAQGMFSNDDLDIVSNFSYYPSGTYKLPVLIGNDPQGKSPFPSNTTNLYGFAQIDSLSAPALGSLRFDHASAVGTDGMNDQGLTVSALVLMASGYESAGIRAVSVSYLDFVSYALGNFRDVEELRAALSGKDRSLAITGCAGAYLSPGIAEACASLPKLHWAVEDKAGSSVVVEFINGRPKIYNNTVGTLTNDPVFPFMKQNLMQYQSITFQTPTSNSEMKQFMSSEGVPPLDGVGFNGFGLPGDASPISRFVRLYLNRAISVENAKPKTLEQVMAQQQAIINSVFLPFGSVPTQHENKFDYTVFDTLKIPSTCTFAYRTYKEMLWKSINVCDPALANVTVPVHKSMMPLDEANPLGIVSLQSDFVN